MKPYILKMRPFLRSKIWGGRKLETEFGKELPDDEPYGEAWEVADLPEGQSVVANGPLEGEPLRKAVERWGEDLIGTNAPREAFPLLVKILDAQKDLSVQVHPGEHDLDDLPAGAESKDECWLILDSDDGTILHGFDEDVDPEEFRRAVEEDRAADMLRRVAVHPGDVIRVVPNTIHAICEGVALLEIQQPSDTTYRVYDYNRPGLDGEPRELHLDRAMQVGNFSAHDDAKLVGRATNSQVGDIEVLVDVDAYRIERFRPGHAVEWRVAETSPQVLFVREGSVRLGCRENAVELGAAETAVLPAGIGHVELTPGDDPQTEVIVTGLGGHPLLKR
jgi:mannose-6-phosphate isomerase